MSFEIRTDSMAGHWTARRVRCIYHEDDSRTIGLARNGEFVAGVIYENWNHRSIMAHIAVEGRITPSFVAAIFDYPFNHCQVEKVICPIPSANAESMRLCKHMGFTEEARIKDAHPEGDIVLFTLARDACRFLGERYAKQITHAA